MEEYMATHRILAEEFVSVSEMRKHPADYFTDRPIAVMNKNQTAGYMVGKELFESMVDLIKQLQPQEEFTAKFQPFLTQLKAATKGSYEFFANAKEEEPEDFIE